MKISVIGAGRVAYHLVKVLSGQHHIVDVFTRSPIKAQHFKAEFDVNLVSNFHELSTEIDLCIIAISDQSIQSVIQSLSQVYSNVLIVHTSGSTHLEILSDVYDRSGVLYPLQTFSVERDVDWNNTPMFVEAKNSKDEELLFELANSLSKKVYRYTSEQRLSLHLAAVFACNFSNYCFDMAKQIVDAKQVDFSLLYPLIEATAQKALLADPKDMQTGPAMRGDVNILNMHEKMLQVNHRTDLQAVYTLLSQQIMQRHGHE